jgi:nucleoid-associated protein YgaU
MKITPWLVLLSLTLVSCSGSKSAQNVDEETPQIELSDADEFIESPMENPLEGDSFATDNSLDIPGDMPLDTGTDLVTDSDIVSDINNDSMIPDSEPLVQESSSLETSPVVINEPGTMKQYTVKKNETLMLIAFKLYGDYEQWKELASQNQAVLKGSTNVSAGTVLSYVAPAQKFVWNPQGLPYLIRTGDTLGGISKQVYNDMRKWKLIWDNNRPLIKDPNKIYAGFTIYYLENGREVANEI